MAQAGLEDRDRPGAYHDLRFHGTAGRNDVVISTTRPELLVLQLSEAECITP